jgi:hypothetical protein
MPPKLTKAQISEVLEQQPIESILLGTSKSRLTTKQKAFCENLARGDTKAGAYRKAYDSKGKPAIQANEGYKLAKRPDIAMMTEAIQKGLEFQKSYSLGQIRALVVSNLTKEATDPDNSASVRVAALRTLGTVAGVDAFQHIAQKTIIHDSETNRAKLLEQLKQAMQDNARTIDGDVSELMAEIGRGKRTIEETHTTPTNQIEPVADELLLHSIPDKQSQESEGEDKQSPSSEASEQEGEVLPEKEADGKADE